MAVQDTVDPTTGLSAGESSIHYIWIDALCIIQHEVTDWLKESKKMQDVYSHSTLTLALAQAGNPTQTCFQGYSPWSTPPFEVGNTRALGDCNCWTAISCDYFDDAPYELPLWHRA
ncbi:hypothetical protein BDV36DRAFT_297086 [Aspergillus pseudocaelatus]|uniref:Heterokaryon incompatibility domain-containing protein n=1 Tax=Aspergillus pseudocaelatus TaxID=1825620 RepID=A0ABQ6WGX1_9EURO|nr:hypothetical protein BDV36DRAFT_297086 [Aspergillus pseudocaelatus]